MQTCGSLPEGLGYTTLTHALRQRSLDILDEFAATNQASD